MTNISIERILCPTDFSAFSAQALRHALALTRRFGSRLKFLYVIPHVFPGSESIYGGAPWSMSPDVRLAAEDEMRRFLEPVREARVDHEIEIREGDPWREIVVTAEELGAELVVLGTHGRGGLDRFILGSVAEKLTRRLPCPVLTVSHEEGRTWATPGLVTRILCAIDFSAPSAEAYRMALAMAAEHKAEVTLLHAVESILDYGGQPYLPVPDAARIREDLERSAQDLLGKTIHDAGESTVKVEPRIVHGRAYQEILRVAAEERSELIVIGAQGHGFLEHLLAGSNAQHVIRRATCPVLTVRPLRVTRRDATEPHGLAVSGSAIRPLCETRTAPSPGTVRDIMTGDAVFVTSNTSVARIAELMDARAISGIPVVDDTRRVIGIVTDLDIIIRNTRIDAPPYLPLLEGRIPLETPGHFLRRIRHMVGMEAADVMTEEVTTISPDDEVEALAELMVKERINLVPVVEGGRLVGVVTRTDIIRWMTRDASPPRPVP